MKISARFLLMFIFFCLLSEVKGDEVKNKLTNHNFPSLKKRKVNLDYCIQLGLNKSLYILKQRYNIEIINVEKEIKQAYFDPIFWISITRNDTLTPTHSTLEGTFTNIQKNTALNIGMTQNLITGGSYSLTFNNLKNYSNSVYQFINPYYKSELTLTINQPLLKNFGIKNAKFEIILTDYFRKISELELKKEIYSLTTVIKKAYWDFIYHFYKLNIELDALKLAQELLRMEEERFKLGEVSQIEILKSEKIVGEYEKKVIDSRAEFYEAEIKLKKVIGILPDEELWLISFEPEEHIQPLKTNLKFSEIYESALKNNIEYLKKKEEIEKEKLFVERFKNQILPELNLILGGGLNGLSGSYRKSLDTLSSNNYYMWQIGIECRFPWNNKEAKKRYKKSKLELEKKKIEADEIKLEIFTEIKQAFNEVENLKEKVKISKKLKEIAEKRLAAEKEKLKRGLASIYDVLKILRELIEIKIEELKDIVNYNIAIIELEALKMCLYKDKE